MLYNWIKIVHVVSSALLFGVGVGMVFYWGVVNAHKDPTYIAQSQRLIITADWLFAALAGVLQPLSGFALIYIKGYHLTSTWWLVTLVGYCLAALCWLPAVFVQLKCQQLANWALAEHRCLPRQYYRFVYARCGLSVVAFASLVAVFYFMTDL